MCETLSNISFFPPLNNDCNLFSSHHYPRFEKDRYKTSDFLLKSRFWSKFSGAQTCYPILHMKNWVLRGYMTSPMWVQRAPAPSSCACTCARPRPPHPPHHWQVPPSLQFFSSPVSPLTVTICSHQICFLKKQWKCFRCKIPKFISPPPFEHKIKTVSKANLPTGVLCVIAWGRTSGDISHTWGCGNY